MQVGDGDGTLISYPNVVIHTRVADQRTARCARVFMLTAFSLTGPAFHVAYTEVLILLEYRNSGCVVLNCGNQEMMDCRRGV